MCFATTNFSLHPASSPNTNPSNFSGCLDSLPCIGETSFQYRVGDFNLGVEGVVPERVGDHTRNPQIQKFPNNSDLSLFVDSNNSEHPSPKNSNGINTFPDLNDPWPVNWTDSSSRPTSWDYSQRTFEDFGLPSTTLIEYSAESCLEFNLSPTIGGVSNFCVLPSDLVNFLGTSGGKSDPWNHFNKHDLTLDYFPTTSQQRLELDNPNPYSTLYAQIPPIGSSKGSQGGPYIDHRERSPRSSNSSLGKSTTTIAPSHKSINAIDRTWPSCNKSFSTRASYK